MPTSYMIADDVFMDGNTQLKATPSRRQQKEQREIHRWKMMPTSYMIADDVFLTSVFLLTISGEGNTTELKATSPSNTQLKATPSRRQQKEQREIHRWKMMPTSYMIADDVFLTSVFLLTISGEGNTTELKATSPSQRQNTKAAWQRVEGNITESKAEHEGNTATG
eukprot:jgi/Psemu1/46525/gm1.46525_g